MLGDRLLMAPFKVAAFHGPIDEAEHFVADFVKVNDCVVLWPSTTLSWSAKRCQKLRVDVRVELF